MTKDQYLKKHEMSKKGHGLTEYDNMKAALIASMGGTVLYNEELFLWGKRVVDILNPK